MAFSISLQAGGCFVSLHPISANWFVRLADIIFVLGLYDPIFYRGNQVLSHLYYVAIPPTRLWENDRRWTTEQTSDICVVILKYETRLGEECKDIYFWSEEGTWTTIFSTTICRVKRRLTSTTSHFHIAGKRSSASGKWRWSICTQPVQNEHNSLCTCWKFSLGHRGDCSAILTIKYCIIWVCNLVEWQLCH